MKPLRWLTVSLTRATAEAPTVLSQITSEHVPVSVSIFSNVPEYDNKPIFICDSNPKK